MRCRTDGHQIQLMAGGQFFKWGGERKMNILDLSAHLTLGLNSLGQTLDEPFIENLTSPSEKASEILISRVSPGNVPVRSLYRESTMASPYMGISFKLFNSLH